VSGLNQRFAKPSYGVNLYREFKSLPLRSVQIALKAVFFVLSPSSGDFLLINKMIDLKTVRVRFAPSPTGYLHVGGLRTALYNYLFARKHNGTFVLRIEDTDRARFVPGAIENLIDTMKWSGIDYDEGPKKEGSCGPYVQSERLNLYKSHADQLIKLEKAYYCFCSPERLEEMRKLQNEIRPKYDKHCLKLSPAEITKNLEKGLPYVIRLNVPESITVRFYDIIRDYVEFTSERIDDQVLIKSDGYPTYHLANVVDDHLMQISHVIRGEEWLSSTPKHVLLYQFFDWELPAFAHLPLLLNADRSKLSKRQGDVTVEDYRDKGYLKEALINFVALLGWNPGTEQEFFYLDELVESFSLEGVNKSGAVFDVEKLNWLNFEHLRKKPDVEILQMLKNELAKSKFSDFKATDEYLLKVIEAMRPRVTFIKDFIEKSAYFFEPPSFYDSEVVKKRWKEDTPAQMKTLTEEYSKLVKPSKEDFESVLHSVALSLNVGDGKLIHPLRLAISGVGGGPGVYDILFILGKEESLKRINTAIKMLA
jgi:glutamyl-tRNA synthetase